MTSEKERRVRHLAYALCEERQVFGLAPDPVADWHLAESVEAFEQFSPRALRAGDRQRVARELTLDLWFKVEGPIPRLARLLYQERVRLNLPGTADGDWRWARDHHSAYEYRLRTPRDFAGAAWNEAAWRLDALKKCAWDNYIDRRAAARPGTADGDWYRAAADLVRERRY